MWPVCRLFVVFDLFFNIYILFYYFHFHLVYWRYFELCDMNISCTPQIFSADLEHGAINVKTTPPPPPLPVCFAIRTLIPAVAAQHCRRNLWRSGLHDRFLRVFGCTRRVSHDVVLVSRRLNFLSKLSKPWCMPCHCVTSSLLRSGPSWNLILENSESMADVWMCDWGRSDGIVCIVCGVSCRGT